LIPVRLPLGRVEFVSVVDAVRCAVDIQRSMIDRNAKVPAENRVQFRVGINVGDIISDDNDIYGDGVNVAARLEALADPGGIYVSRVVHDQVRDKHHYRALETPLVLRDRPQFVLHLQG
jgi:adenylate cyclase